MAAVEEQQAGFESVPAQPVTEKRPWWERWVGKLMAPHESERGVLVDDLLPAVYSAFRHRGREDGKQ